MSVISWGKQQRFPFSSNGKLEPWSASTVAAIYAITYRRDPLNKPKSHTVVYFGESDNLALNEDGIKRQIKQAWLDDGFTQDDLFIFVHAMENSARIERMKILERLVMEYQPEGNKVHF